MIGSELEANVCKLMFGVSMSYDLKMQVVYIRCFRGSSTKGKLFKGKPVRINLPSSPR